MSFIKTTTFLPPITSPANISILVLADANASNPVWKQVSMLGANVTVVHCPKSPPEDVQVVIDSFKRDDDCFEVKIAPDADMNAVRYQLAADYALQSGYSEMYRHGSRPDIIQAEGWRFAAFAASYYNFRYKRWNCHDLAHTIHVISELPEEYVGRHKHSKQRYTPIKHLGYPISYIADSAGLFEGLIASNQLTEDPVLSEHGFKELKMIFDGNIYHKHRIWELPEGNFEESARRYLEIYKELMQMELHRYGSRLWRLPMTTHHG